MTETTVEAVPARREGAATGGLGRTLPLALGTFAVGTDAYVLAGFLPRMAASLQVSTSAAGQAVTVFAAAYALLSPVVAAVVSRVPRRALLVTALLVLAAANAASALAPNLPLLLAARVLAAVGAAAFTPTAGAVAATLVRPALRARALAVVIGGLTAATALGVPVGDALGRLMGWRGALGLVAALCLATAVVARGTLPSLPGAPRVGLRARLAVLRRPGVAVVLPLTALGMTAAYTVYAYAVPALHAVGIDAAGTPWILAAYGLGALAGNLLTGVAADRAGARPTLVACYLVLATALASLGMLAVTGVHAPPLVALLAAAWGASSFGQTPPQQHRLIGRAPDQAPLLVALNASAIYCGIGGGTALGGLLAPAGAAVMFAVGAGTAVASLAWLLITARARDQR